DRMSDVGPKTPAGKRGTSQPRSSAVVLRARIARLTRSAGTGFTTDSGRVASSSLKLKASPAKSCPVSARYSRRETASQTAESGKHVVGTNNRHAGPALLSLPGPTSRITSGAEGDAPAG